MKALSDLSWFIKAWSAASAFVAMFSKLFIFSQQPPFDTRFALGLASVAATWVFGLTKYLH